MLEWIKVVGPILVSWPVIGLVAIILFRKPLFRLLDQFSNADIRKAKFGPIEVERELHKLAGEIKEQQIEQERQKAEIDTLKFLITYFVTDAELKHLEGLESGKAYPYVKATYFEQELRRLRSLGLILNRPGTGIRGMPSEGDLGEHFDITERGRRYLELRRQE